VRLLGDAGFLSLIAVYRLNTLGYADLPEERMSRATSVASVAQQMSMGVGVTVGAWLLQMASVK